ncbi:MAG TPA: hypothetical protein ENJ41_03265 [Oceanospirillales bacterium]|nr:hypothetical protein [Oceanospirillales bacterium]
MANIPEVILSFNEECGDCGKRRVDLPQALPPIGDDFDWDIRDYDGFRIFMLEELAARYPERRSWMPADMELVLIETLSVVLDQLSDMHDRVMAESFLETARRPDSVRRLLQMIGYNPNLHIDVGMIAKIKTQAEIKLMTSNAISDQELAQLWDHYPHLMDEAKQAGPRSIQQQRRMVTLEDYRNQLLDHPLVLDVDAYSRWTGSWNTHFLVIRLINNLLLDDKLNKKDLVQNQDNLDVEFELFTAQMEDFYQQQEIATIPGILGRTARFMLQDIIQQQRMIGQEVILQDVELVGIVLSISIRIAGDFFRSQIEDAVRFVLLNPVDGFFSASQLQFGEDVVASNIIETIMAVDGVQSLCINRLKRIGAIYADQSGSGRIILQGREVAVLEDNNLSPERGSLTIKLHGGKIG